MPSGVKCTRLFHVPQDDVFKEIFEQAENFKKYESESEEYSHSSKLISVEDDRDVRNLIFNRLQLNPDISDGDLQIEVMKEYAERYPDMKIMDWKRIVNDYTPLVRETVKQPTAEIIEMQQRQYGMAAEPTGDYNNENE